MEPAVFADTGRERFRRFVLEWPVTFAGRSFAAIGLKRLTAGEVAAFQDRVRKSPEGAAFDWPIYVDEAGADLPDGLISALDADDRDAIDRAVVDFLPRRFLGAASGGSEPASGGNTA